MVITAHGFISDPNDGKLKYYVRSTRFGTRLFNDEDQGVDYMNEYKRRYGID